MSAGKLIFVEGTTPTTTPNTGEWYLYTKSDGLYIKDDTGTETQIIAPKQPNVGTEATKTIASGIVATSEDRNLIIASESGTADDLIEITGLTVGDIVALRANSGHTITAKHNDAGATIKILIQDDADEILDEVHPLVLMLVSTNQLVQLYRA